VQEYESAKSANKSSNDEFAAKEKQATAELASTKASLLALQQAVRLLTQVNPKPQPSTASVQCRINNAEQKLSIVAAYFHSKTK
jgi:hypothetical protein